MNKEQIQEVCDDCGKPPKGNDYCFRETGVCENCLENYENKTGYCSVGCRITGRCDETC